MSRTIVLFQPYDNETNLYIKRMREMYEIQYDVKSFADFLRRHLFSGYKVNAVSFNWIENDRLYHICLYLLWAKIFGIKVIWTFHNKQPHESGNTSLTRLKLKMMKILSNRIILHSKNSLQELNSKKAEMKAVYIPHINYIGAYPEASRDIRCEKNISNETFVFLFVGAIRPYKNIEMLISAMHELALPNALLYIAGRPYSESYGKEIEELGKSADNVMLDLRFVPDSEMPDYLKMADVVVLPYNINSSMNSGSMIMSFSYKKTVIVPLIAMAKDWEETGVCYSYSYTAGNQSEHKDNLKREMKKAYDDGREKLKQSGVTAYSLVSKNNGEDVVEQEINKMLEK